MNRTIQRSVEVLDLIANRSDGMTLKEISDAIKIPKSSAFDIIHTLVMLKFAEVSKYNSKKYILGVKAFSLGMKYIGSLSLIETCATYLNPLADDLNRTGFVAILDGEECVYVHKHVGKNAKLVTCGIGTRHELYCTSLGKALLAYSSNEVVSKIIDNINFNKKQSNTLSSKDDLLEELEQTRKRGYSMDNREVEKHMMCFGAPIFDYTGQVVAAISLSDMYNPDIVNDDIGNKVAQTARMISNRLGYMGNY